MIPQMTSHDFNNILTNANQKLENVLEEVDSIKSDISKKLKIIRYESEYIEDQMQQLTIAHKNSSDVCVNGELKSNFVTFDSLLSDGFMQYGCTSTPKFKNQPLNVFNILATATGDAFYRDIVEVSINDVVKEEYKNILKHDSIQDKALFFEEMSSKDPSIKLTMTLDKSKTIGSSSFNVIEFDPFLNGAYTIDYIRIYPQNNVEFEEFTQYEYAGKMRILLNKEYNFNKVEIKITPNFNTQVNGEDRYPIGIKHIYFYKASFLSDMHGIVEINSNEYIDIIKDDFIVKTPNEDIVRSAKTEGVEFYLSKSVDTEGNVTLTTLQDPSTDTDIKTIALNTKTIYAKIPIKQESVVGFNFKYSNKVL